MTCFLLLLFLPSGQPRNGSCTGTPRCQARRVHVRHLVGCSHPPGGPNPAPTAERIGDTGRSLLRASRSSTGVPDRTSTSHSSGSYSTPIGFIEKARRIKAFA